MKNFQVFRYFHEVREELKKVTWPSRKQTIQKTLVVVIASIIVGIYIGGLDFLFTQATSFLIK